MLRTLTATVFLAALSACTFTERDAPHSVVFIEFQGLEPSAIHGILAVSNSVLDRREVLKFEGAIWTTHRTGSLPLDLNACFFLDNHRYGLTRTERNADGSILFELDRYADAGQAYRIELHPDGTISGRGGFWSVNNGGSDTEAAMTGTYHRVESIEDCTRRFPRNRQ
jgi:hypothetical protein